MATDAYVATQPDSTGKKVQTFETKNNNGDTVEAQATVEIDPSTGTPARSIDSLRLMVQFSVQQLITQRQQLQIQSSQAGQFLFLPETPFFGG